MTATRPLQFPYSHAAHAVQDCMPSCVELHSYANGPQHEFAAIT